MYFEWSARGKFDGRAWVVNRVDVFDDEGNVCKTLRLGNEYQLVKGSSVSHHIKAGVERVKIDFIKPPFQGGRFEDILCVENLTPKLWNSPPSLWVSVYDLEEIPKVSETDADKPADQPASSPVNASSKEEEDPGYGAGV